MKNKLLKIKFTLLAFICIALFFAIYPNQPVTVPVMNHVNISKPFQAATVMLPLDQVAYRTPATVRLPILMYHHITEDGDPETSITAENFEEHMSLLLENGYTPILFDDLIGYVDYRNSLPSKPICITFDDGYYSNYELAFPILKKYNMKATIFVIGSSVGRKDTYKNTGFAITPHFDYKEAAEMIHSGLISVQSHTYDMHQNTAYDGKNARINVAPLPGEVRSTYAQRIMDDFSKIKTDIFENLGTSVNTVAYPKGQFDYISESVLHRMGVKVTLSTKKGVNLIMRGEPTRLHKMYRYNIERNVTAKALLKMLESRGNT